jgi:hypothetical protein
VSWGTAGDDGAGGVLDTDDATGLELTRERDRTSPAASGAPATRASDPQPVSSRAAPGSGADLGVCGVRSRSRPG